MTAHNRIEPPEVVRDVEEYVRSELAEYAKDSRKLLLDESGVWSLHALAADIYAKGWKDGEFASEDKVRHQIRRDRDREKPAEDEKIRARRAEDFNAGWDEHRRQLELQAKDPKHAIYRDNPHEYGVVESRPADPRKAATR